MHPLTTTDLMATWDAAATLEPAARPLALLAAACPEHSADELACLPVGTRDAMLLSQREWAFGADVSSLADCPRCAQPVEMRFRISDVCVDGPPPPPTIDFRSRGHRLRIRVPSAADLEAAAQATDETAALAVLLRRCILRAARGGEAVAIDELSDEVVLAIEARMAQADPQADMAFTLSCPACGHCWPAPFDIAEFFWAEIEAWARRVLHDVHVLAMAYGWREPDVLALSPRRRQHYLDMVGV